MTFSELLAHTPRAAEQWTGGFNANWFKGCIANSIGDAQKDGKSRRADPIEIGQRDEVRRDSDRRRLIAGERPCT
jgi:hypothetical protein